MTRRIALGLAALIAAPGLALAVAPTSRAAAGCDLQAMVDRGGLIAVPSGCEEDGPLVVSRDVEIGGGPFAVADAVTVAKGATLTLVEGLTVRADVFIEPGGGFGAVGADISVRGQLWVMAGAVARIGGGGGTGVIVDRVINDGALAATGLVHLGDPQEGIQTLLSGSSYMSLGAISPGSRIWFRQPAAAQAVALVAEGGLGIDPADVVFCDGGGCTPTVAGSGGSSSFLILDPSSAPPPPTEPPPTEEPTDQPTTEPPPVVVEPIELQDLVYGARTGAVLDVPKDVVLGDVVVIATEDGRPLDLTLTGGPIKRDHGGALIEVPAGSNLTLQDIAVDGAGGFTGAVAATAAAVRVASGASLTLGAGAVIKDNPSYGIVNQGELHLTGVGAAVTGCTLRGDDADPSGTQVGGAGVWNRAGGSFYMGEGRISGNYVKSARQGAAYGGGVLNAGAMWIYGGAVTGNRVDGAGGGLAVVREAGSTQVGRLEFGTYSGQVEGSTPPVESGN
ncbi:MAG: hypothetical protein LBL01_03745, partial [Bifidobacteriaceae bacterium]|nr:hypothetical protein [Bifidobacteriaceae bacterium]